MRRRAAPSLAGCDETTVEALRTYGYSLGMAFQIVDDILDYTGDEELMGKPVGSDLLEGTVTLPGLLFLERYPRNNPIKRFFTARRERHLRLQEAIGAILASDVIEASMDIARDYIRRANAALDVLPGLGREGLPGGPRRVRLEPEKLAGLSCRGDRVRG